MSVSEEKTCNEDSKQPTLVQDLVISILERLSFADFHRARCISREWYYASKTCIRVTTPWIILFPRVHDVENNNSSELIDPRDHSSYTVRDLGFDMARGRCLASSGFWFLMSDHRVEFHLLNLFTRERIPLPPLESTDGCPMEFVRINDYNDVWVTLNHENKASRKKASYYTVMGLRIGKAVLWVDEESRDYLVVWNYEGFFAYHKKGDDNNSWKLLEPLNNQRCVDMVCNESKLYVLSDTRVTVLDFSRGDSPVECASFKSPYYRFPNNGKNLGVTLSGEVLIVTSGGNSYQIYLVDVYKMDPKSLEWSIINSIGDEALLLDIGITVAAKDGVMKNCIYFIEHPYIYDGGNSVYHIETSKVVQVYQPWFTKIFKSARWFLNGCFKPTSSFVFRVDYFLLYCGTRVLQVFFLYSSVWSQKGLKTILKYLSDL